MSAQMHAVGFGFSLMCDGFPIELDDLVFAMSGSWQFCMARIKSLKYLIVFPAL